MIKKRKSNYINQKQSFLEIEEGNFMQYGVDYSDIEEIWVRISELESTYDQYITSRFPAIKRFEQVWCRRCNRRKKDLIKVSMLDFFTHF